MSALKELQAAQTLGQLAVLLNIPLRMLAYILYKRNKEELYKKFEIPKKCGGVREICAPTRDLKLLQHRLSELLYTCSVEINTHNRHVEDQEHQGISHGFKPYHSILTNGRAHVTKRFVFNVDLEDFFGSFNFGRVRGFFIKNKNFQLHEKVATGIAQIACYENKLPQGSPCSPVITNLIAHSLDIFLAKLAKSEGATYSRYADDLTFSSNSPEFPENIAIISEAHRWEPGPELQWIVQRNGFGFNEKKTRMQYKDSRQEVTGLTVNRKVNSTVSYRKTVRSMANSLFNSGKFEFIFKKNDEEGVPQVKKSEGTVKKLIGMLSYIDYVDRFNSKLRDKNKLDPIQTPGRLKLFRRVIYFDKFYALDKPILVCEGKTDNVYLRCAIKSLKSDYPRLIDAGEGVMKVNFLKYAERRTASVTELTGGVGGLCKLLKNYHEDLTVRFRAPMPKHPVIIFIDNDKGANSVYEAIAGITKRPRPKGKAEFIHVMGNLYVVPTPVSAAMPETAIEDFFDDVTLKKTVDGRGFSRKNDEDDPKFYGKATFAHKVVAAAADEIDFKGFKPLLDRIVAVVENYDALLKKK